jgi:hypothetical protein
MFERNERERARKAAGYGRNGKNSVPERQKKERQRSQSRND